MTCQPEYKTEPIDLRRHGLIEASAGTGKTYTLENLVVRLLREQDDVELENILMVTFTEKAASELKIRIREKLEAELNDPALAPNTFQKLRLCVDEFDRAAIHTIHGFCQSVLRDFAFENSAPFQNELIQDGPLYETLLKEQMRKAWPDIYGGDLAEVLELSQFSEKKDRFMATIIRLAMSLHEEAGDRLLPDLGQMGFKEIKEEIALACMGVKSMISPGFSDRYDKLNFNKSSKSSILQKIVVPVEDFFSKFTQDALDLHTLSELMSEMEGTQSAGRKGLDCLIPEKWNKAGPNMEACPELMAVKEGLEEVSRRLKEFRHCLTVKAVHLLQADVARTKQAHGWISYDDMLSRVEKALMADNGDELLKSLRTRFKVAFIDEFQDTDPVQWRIFRKIFVEGTEPSQNRLFVIGDPKQAIYAFRGADVYAYLAARNEMARLAEKGEAGIYSLSVNWRSQPQLLAVFNRLFGLKTWFTPHASADSFEIGYQKIIPPKTEERRQELTSDQSGRPVLTIVDLRKSPSPRPAKLRLARFVAQEIRHLTQVGIRIKEKGKVERPIGFGDMAILVRGRSDLPLLEDELTQKKIPYAFYKKPGLFASDEAVYTSLIFHAILDPGDSSAVKKGLLTPFFGQQVQDLYGYDEMPPTHPIKELLFRWNGYAITRRWGYLFQSLMEESGLMAREAGEMGWDRKSTNYRQIFEYLKEVAYRKNLDFRGVSALLDLHRNAPWMGDEGTDIHQIETESGKVQIMTMHVSKGLQFPVVFVAGGLTQPAAQQDPYQTYHDISEGEQWPEITRMIDLGKSATERCAIERRDEDKRLYYVAATRAQFKLYLPFYQYDKDASWVGPVCTLLSPALAEAFPRGGKGPDVLWVSSDATPDDVTLRVRPVTVSGGQTIPKDGGFDDLLIPESYEERQIRVDSFSSLHRSKARADETATEAISFELSQEGREEDELFGAWEMPVVLNEGTVDEIPGGTDVGLMFHGILERIDYRVARGSGFDEEGAVRHLLEDPGTREIIQGQMAVYRLDEQWQDAVCRIIWSTLTAPVPLLGLDFTLSRLKREDRLHEAAFYYLASGLFGGSRLTAGKGAPNRFVRGYIDLIFRNGGKYYVADWKSNYLETGYDQESMARSMADADYHLQYRLYAIAALRWLRQSLGKRFDPKKHWGGVFYFYLRGMGGPQGDGIYYVPPHQLGPLDQLEEEICWILNT